MDIKVRLFATLREGRQRELQLKLSDGATVQEAINKLNIKKEEIAILLVNGRDGKLDMTVADGDILSIFPPVGGG